MRPSRAAATVDAPTSSTRCPERLELPAGWRTKWRSGSGSPLAQVLRLAVRTHEERVEMPWPTERDSELFAVIERERERSAGVVRPSARSTTATSTNPV